MLCFGRHIVFIMLCQHFVGMEEARALQFPLGDDPFPFTEKIGQYAGVAHRYCVGIVSDGKLHGESVALDATRLHDSTDPKMPLQRCFTGTDLSRREEKDQAILEGIEYQPGCDADRGQAARNDRDAFMALFHCWPSSLA